MGTLSSHFQMPRAADAAGFGGPERSKLWPLSSRLSGASPAPRTLSLPDLGGMEEAPWLAWRSLSVYSSLGSQPFPLPNQLVLTVPAGPTAIDLDSAHPGALS